MTTSANEPANADDTTSTVATGLSQAAVAADTGNRLIDIFGKPWALSWEDSGVSTSVLLQNGGEAPTWLANPKLKWTVAPDATNAAVDLRFIGKAAPWLERGGNLLGAAGVTLEISHGLYTHNDAEIGHGVADGTVWGVSLALSPVISPLGSFAVGLLWTGVDMLAQDYTYQGKSGWTAIFTSLRDKGRPAWRAVWSAQEQMRQEDPNFYSQLWSQPKE